MDDRERLQWLPARAERDRISARANAWGLTLLHAFPLLAVCLLALLRGRPDIAAATLVLAIVAFGLLYGLLRPRRHRLAVAAAGTLPEVNGRR